VSWLVNPFTSAPVDGRRDRYHRLGFAIPFALAAALTPAQVVVGDWAAKFLPDYQPVKLAAIEGLYETTEGAPLSVGGIYHDDELRYAVEIPKRPVDPGPRRPRRRGRRPGGGPADERPPVNIVRWSFQLMVGVGTALLDLSAWFALAWWRRRDLPRSPWFLRAASLAGVGAVRALEAGWVVTEVGRQPWVVYGLLRTEDAVNPAPGLQVGLYAVTAVYVLLTVATVSVLRRMTRSTPVPVAPQETDVQDISVTGASR
jgi:cytochrome d ubiquinol oxidase subunit I